MNEVLRNSYSLCIYPSLRLETSFHVFIFQGKFRTKFERGASVFHLSTGLPISNMQVYWIKFAAEYSFYSKLVAVEYMSL